jgi:hypothetical protein
MLEINHSYSYGDYTPLGIGGHLLNDAKILPKCKHVTSIKPLELGSR